MQKKRQLFRLRCDKESIMAIHGPNRNQGIHRSPGAERYFPAGSGGDVAAGKPSDQINFHHFYENFTREKISGWKNNYDKWIEWNQNFTDVIEAFDSDPRFSGKALTELDRLVHFMNEKKSELGEMLKEFKALWERDPGSEDPNLVPAPRMNARNYVLHRADALQYWDFLRVATMPAREPQPPAQEPAAQAVQEVSPPPIVSITPATPAPAVVQPRPQAIDHYRSKFLSLGVGIGRSYGNYRYFSPPLVGSRRDERDTIYDAAVTSVSPPITGERDVEFPTLQVQAIFHPWAFLQEQDWWNAISILGNFQAVKKRLDRSGAYFQMFQAGVGLDLEPLFQKRLPLDISAHAYFFEWGREAFKKTEFREYTRFSGWFPFVQTGICGGWNVNENITLQGCGDWREEGFSSEFVNMWGKSGDSVDFYILSANLLYHFRK